jgi:hypothetical protein
MRLKIRKIKHRTRKWFGHPDESWARLGGPNGKKSCYGHYSGLGNPGWRTKKEIKDADDKRLEQIE